MKLLQLTTAFTLIQSLCADIVVNTNVDEIQNDSKTSLREAILQAEDGDVISFDAAVFTGSQASIIKLSGEEIVISKSIVIDASGLAENVTINGNDSVNSFRIFNISLGVENSLYNLTFSDGKVYSNINADNNGGAILNKGTLNLTNCHFEGNYAQNGGAIYHNSQGSSALLNLDSCTFEDNGAVINGGAICVEGGSTVILSNCTLYGNNAEKGGGIYHNIEAGSSTFALVACSLEKNGATNHGGAIYNNSGTGSTTLDVSRSTLSYNTSLAGGGIYFRHNSSAVNHLSLNHCTLHKNHSRTYGGGVSIFSDEVEGRQIEFNLMNCTITHNSAINRGGGIDQEGLSLINLGMHNTILAANIALVGSDMYDDGILNVTASGNNLISSNEGSSLAEGVADAHLTILGTSPVLLSPLGYYGGSTKTMHPLVGSPALSISSAITRTDQRGLSVTGPLTSGSIQIGQRILVNSVNDTETEVITLRKALDDLNSSPLAGTVIHFDEAILSGETITLAEGQLIVSGAVQGLFIDASRISTGLTIDANGEVTNDRVLELQPGASVGIHGITFTGGIHGNRGGAIYNHQAVLSMSLCTVSGNYAERFGGGICSHGNGSSATLCLSECSIFDNSTNSLGGGIMNDGYGGEATLIMNNSSVYDNDARFSGGGICNFGRRGEARSAFRNSTIANNSAFSGGGISSENTDGTVSLDLEQCTLSGNSASNGGGIFIFNSEGRGSMKLTNSIIAGNVASLGPDLYQDEFEILANGTNIVSSLADTAISGTLAASYFIVLDLKPISLAPLGHYGGPTFTMPPLLSSPAIDATDVTDNGGVDQRGFNRFINGSLDIGSVEFQGVDEELPAAFSLDWDGDGVPNGLELAIGNDPAVSNSRNENNLQMKADGTLSFGYNPEHRDSILLTLTSSTDLENFNDVIIDSNNSLFLGISMQEVMRLDAFNADKEKLFYRLKAELK